MQKREYLTDDTIVFPALVKRYELLSDVAKSSAILNQIQEGRVYKAYDHEQGIMIFPDGSDEAAVFEDYKVDNEFYIIEIIHITEENMADYMEHLSDEDISIVDDLIGKTINEERSEMAIEERINSIDYEKVKKRMAEKYSVTDKEVLTAFNALRKKDPVMAKATLEIVVYCLAMLNQSSVVDSTMVGIMMDRTFGKGAFTSNAMNSLIQYAKNDEKGSMVHVLRLAFFTLMEASRNIE